MRIGQKVKIKDNHMTQAWGIANEVGVITEPDPKGRDENVVAVKLDSEKAICAICEAGIHIGNLEPA